MNCDNEIVFPQPALLNSAPLVQEYARAAKPFRIAAFTAFCCRNRLSQIPIVANRQHLLEFSLFTP